MIVGRDYKVVYYCADCNSVWGNSLLPDLHSQLSNHFIYRAIISVVSFHNDKSIRRPHEKRKDPTLRKRAN
jgi:hypothetical protein